MDVASSERAIAAAIAVASGLGIAADHVAVLNASNRLVLRLMPGDIVVRVGPPEHRAGFVLEVEASRRLSTVGAPVARLEPRSEPVVHEQDGFVLSLWAHHAPVPSALAEAAYGDVLSRFHAAARGIDLEAPLALDRVAAAQAAIADRRETPELGDEGRALISAALDHGELLLHGAGTRSQLLHGEPHLENVLPTADGVLILDLETCCRGPVEFDLAHCFGPSASGLGFENETAVLASYPGADPDLVKAFRRLITAMITTWRWRHDDQLPGRDRWRRWGLEALASSSRTAHRELP